MYRNSLMDPRTSWSRLLQPYDGPLGASRTIFFRARRAEVGLRRISGIYTRRWPEHDALEPDQLAQRPGLERTAARRVRRLRIGDLADVAEAGLGEVREQRCDEALASGDLGLWCVASDLDPGLDERPEQPRPDGALVVRAVTLEHAAFVAACVSEVCRFE